MPDLPRYAGQAIVYAAIMAAIGVLSNWPAYHQIPGGAAQIKLSFTHGAARKVACRRLTSQEIAKLPPNERRPNTCGGERADVHVELLVDGETLYKDRLKPIGLSGDGPSRAYRKFLVPAGEHLIEARLRDTVREDGYDYTTTRSVRLEPLQNLAIDFKADAGGFQFR